MSSAHNQRQVWTAWNKNYDTTDALVVGLLRNEMHLLCPSWHHGFVGFLNANTLLLHYSINYETSIFCWPATMSHTQLVSCLHNL